MLVNSSSTKEEPLLSSPSFSTALVVFFASVVITSIFSLPLSLNILSSVATRVCGLPWRCVLDFERRQKRNATSAPPTNIPLAVAETITAAFESVVADEGSDAAEVDVGATDVRVVVEVPNVRIRVVEVVDDVAADGFEVTLARVDEVVVVVSDSCTNISG